MRMKVYVRLKPGVLDVQGKAVERAVENLGFADVGNVRIGKLIELDVEAESVDAAKQKTEQICQEFLVNPIIEHFEIREA